jgi:ABC-type multidrug transport system ATPase subunit
VYILDDPLSAVDAVVGRRLFQACMSGVLKNSIVVLVTHHLQYAQLADAMLVVDKGEVLAYGSFDKIMNMIKADDQNEGKQRLKAVLNEVNIMHTGEDHMDDTSLDKCKVDNHVDCCSYPQVLAISNPLSLRPQSYLDALSDDSFTDETMQDIVHECVEAECPEVSCVLFCMTYNFP